MLLCLHIKVRHGFILNHSKCLKALSKETHLEVRTIQSNNLGIGEKVKNGGNCIIQKMLTLGDISHTIRKERVICKNLK